MSSTSRPPPQVPERESLRRCTALQSLTVVSKNNYLDAFFGVLADADGGLIFGRAQQVQDILIVDLLLQSIDR